MHTDAHESVGCHLDGRNGHSEVAIGVAVGKTFRAHRSGNDDRHALASGDVLSEIVSGFGHGVRSVRQNDSVDWVAILEALCQSIIDFQSHGRAIVIGDFRAVLLADSVEFVFERRRESFFQQSSKGWFSNLEPPTIGCFGIVLVDGSAGLDEENLHCNSSIRVVLLVSFLYICIVILEFSLVLEVNN